MRYWCLYFYIFCWIIFGLNGSPLFSSTLKPPRQTADIKSSPTAAVTKPLTTPVATTTTPTTTPTTTTTIPTTTVTTTAKTTTTTTAAPEPKDPASDKPPEPSKSTPSTPTKVTLSTAALNPNQPSSSTSKESPSTIITTPSTPAGETNKIPTAQPQIGEPCDYDERNFPYCGAESLYLPIGLLISIIFNYIF